MSPKTIIVSVDDSADVRPEDIAAWLMHTHNAPNECFYPPATRGRPVNPFTLKLTPAQVIELQRLAETADDANHEPANPHAARGLRVKLRNMYLDAIEDPNQADERDRYRTRLLDLAIMSSEGEG